MGRFTRSDQWVLSVNPPPGKNGAQAPSPEIPQKQVDLLDQRIKDAQEDEVAAKTDADRQKAAHMVDDLKLVRAAF